MASGREVRMMESSKIDLLTQLLAACVSLLQDAVIQDPAVSQIPTQRPRSKRHKSPDLANGKAEDDDNPEDRRGVVVPIGPLLRQPINPDEEYDLHFVADYLHVGEQTVRKRIRDKVIKAELKGEGRGKWLITGEEIIRHSKSMSNGEDQ